MALDRWEGRGGDEVKCLIEGSCANQTGSQHNPLKLQPGRGEKSVSKVSLSTF